jgi:hypothetical protein
MAALAFPGAPNAPLGYPIWLRAETVNDVEPFLTIAGVFVVCGIVFVLTRVAAAGLRLSARYFVIAVQPPSLTHLTSIVAAWLEERQAEEAARLRSPPPPPPAIVGALRAFTTRARDTTAGSPSI